MIVSNIIVSYFLDLPVHTASNPLPLNSLLHVEDSCKTEEGLTLC